MPESDRASDFSREPIRRTVAGTADAAMVPRETAGEPARTRMRRPALLLTAVVSGLIVSLAFLETQPELTAAVQLPVASVADRAALSEDSGARAAGRRSLAPTAVPLPAVAATTPTNEAEPLVTDLRGAIELLAASQGEPTWGRVRRFLREHGPDAEGFDLLDALTIPKFVTPLVIPPVTNNDGIANSYDISVRQFKQQILPGGIWNTLNGRQDALPATPVWSYGPAADSVPAIAPDPGSQFNYPAYTVETLSNTPVSVRTINDLVTINPATGHP